MNVNTIRNSSVKTVTSFASLRDAAEIMDQQHVGFLAVSMDDEVVGSITAKDIILRAVSHGRSIYKTTVAEVMTVNVPASHEEPPVDEDTLHMNQRQANQCLW